MDSIFYLTFFILLAVQPSNNPQDEILTKDWIGWLISGISGGAAAWGLFYAGRAYSLNSNAVFTESFYDIFKEVRQIESSYPGKKDATKYKEWKNNFLNYMGSLAWLIQKGKIPNYRFVASHFKEEFRWALYYINQERNEYYESHKDVVDLCNEYPAWEAMNYEPAEVKTFSVVNPITTAYPHQINSVQVNTMEVNTVQFQNKQKSFGHITTSSDDINHSGQKTEGGSLAIQANKRNKIPTFKTSEDQPETASQKDASGDTQPHT